MKLEVIIRNLCTQVPRAIGAVLCDYEGETVVSGLGRTAVSPEAARNAREHIPRSLVLTMPVGEFLVRLAGAEPCALLRMFEDMGRPRGAGDLRILEVRYREIELLVHCLPNDYYLVLVLRRPAITAAARRHLEQASELMAEHVA